SDHLHWMRASVHTKKGDAARAQADLRTLSTLPGPYAKKQGLAPFVDPPKPPAPMPLSDDQRKEVARLLALAEGAHDDVKRASKLAETILTIDPHQPRALEIRAGAANVALRPDDAIHSCNQAILVRPDSAPAYVIRARAYLNKKMFERAIADLTI